MRQLIRFGRKIALEPTAVIKQQLRAAMKLSDAKAAEEADQRREQRQEAIMSAPIDEHFNIDVGAPKPAEPPPEPPQQPLLEGKGRRGRWRGRR